jgi:Spy/CpxP family protein refolding chaperone
MKAMKTVRLVLAVAGVLMAGGFAGAQAPGGEMGQGFAMHRPPMERSLGLAGGQFWNNPNIAKQLNLTDDQRKAMDGILQDHRMKLIDLQANLERAEVAMGPLLKADTPDRGQIEAQIDKVVQSRAALEKANSLFLLDLRMQLKPDQWKQLQTIRQNHMAGDRMRDRMREGGPGAWGQGHPGGQFRRQQPPPPAGGAPQEPPTGAPPAGGSPGAGPGIDQ